MMGLTQLQDLLHTLSQGLLIPTIVILLLLVAAGVWSIGSVLAEALTERRILRENIPQLLAALSGEPIAQMETIIAESRILKRQKTCLLELLHYRTLSPAERRAVAKRILASEDDRHDRILSRTEVIARLGPMFGLMGTLIPLGPGVIALGQGDTATLSASLLTAFDTTIAGLASAAVGYLVTKLRQRWYENDMISMESLMECLLEEMEHAA